MKKLFHFLNPIAHLGEKHYSMLFPLMTTLAAAVILEFIAFSILQDPNAVGLAAIFVFIALIVYFAFREGIRGGLITAFLTVSYYLYIIFTRDYSGQQLKSGLETTAALGALYFLIAWIIGWLKQTIDTLIEREANERQRLHTIIQQLPVGVVVCDANGLVILANKYMDLILGRKVKENIVVRRDTDPKATYRGKPVTPTQWPLAQALESGKTVAPKEIVFERHDGSRRFVQVSASAIHDKAGKVIAAATILNDITPLKELEERKDDFVNMASHELKTPITSMKLYIDTLLNKMKKSGDKENLRIVRGVKDQSDKLQGLVNDLLDVSRLQTGKMTFNYEVFRLDELINETLEGLKQTTKNQQIIFPSKTQVTVNADRFRIYQVITNLITNAAKYSPEDTEIIVRLVKEKGRAVVSVKDKGIGILPEQQKKIFERLYQVSSSPEQSTPGLGMGLYIVKAIVKHHRGEIWVESTPGKGSTFYFTLPLSRER